MAAVCDYCGEEVASQYAFVHEDAIYSGHKRCMGAPMLRKLTQVSTLPNIGLIGKLRAGKDEAARHLASKYGYTAFAFGDELKRDFHRRYREIPRDPKPRVGYQMHGQLMREYYGEDVWINECLEGIELARHNADIRAVITDTRQLNEAERLKSEGYVLIRVEAPEALRIQRAISSGDRFNLRDLTHGTETALDDYSADFTVTNDGDLAHLHRQIDDIIRQLSGSDSE
ncbi:adenylate kinase [Paenibacillus polysaccharolyticus]|uniref:adenylate kinase n=1 Tax=Paenibacillus polysaccharolyticus TaxID=582692 RepID=UPI0030090F46